MSKILSKQDIVQAQDIVLEKVEVPEWGGAVYVRSISAKERGLIEEGAAKYKEQKGKDGSFARTFTVRLAGLAICDELGVPFFKEGEVELLAQKNAAVVARISEVAQRLSGFSKEDLEELEKNSLEAQPEGSPSA